MSNNYSTFNKVYTGKCRDVYEVKEDDIWNIDSIVKKNNKKSKKGVIRFAEDIEDLKS